MIPLACQYSIADVGGVHEAHPSPGGCPTSMARDRGGIIFFRGVDTDKLLLFL